MQRLNRKGLLEVEGCRPSLLVERDLVGKELRTSPIPVARRLGGLRKYSERTSQRLRARRRKWNGTTTKKGKRQVAGRRKIRRGESYLRARRRKWNGTTTKKGKRQVKRRKERGETRV
jgi:hypothetical protein